MEASTQPLFIVGTGRSGTRSFFRMLAGTPDLEIHHEYDVLRTQRISCLRAMERIGRTEVFAHLRASHALAINAATSHFWCDSSNKLSWIVPELAQLFPRAKFLCLVRDGRKVVASYYYKLREEMYDDKSTLVMKKWLEGCEAAPEPPPEKKYWWAFPPIASPHYATFKQYSRLQRVAWHWSACNRTIIDAFAELSNDRAMIARLEDVCEDQAALQRVITFLGIPFDSTFAAFLKTPRNVFIPLDFQLTRSQLSDFWEICGGMMRTLGYIDRQAYDVRY